MKNISRTTKIIIASLVVALGVVIGGGTITPNIDPPSSAKPTVNQFAIDPPSSMPPVAIDPPSSMPPRG